MFNFKQFVKRTNEQYFTTAADPIEALDEVQIEQGRVSIKQEPKYSVSFVKEEHLDPEPDKHDEESLVEFKYLTPSNTSSREWRRIEENRKNAERQRELRSRETPEQRELRRQKNADQARRRRQRLKVEDPETYQIRLAQIAEAKRHRRKHLGEEQRAELLRREAEAARQRRQHLTAEQKAVIREKHREAARNRRGTNVSPRSSFSDSLIDSNSWTPETSFKAET